MRLEIHEKRHKEAYERALVEVAKYDTSTELRKTDFVLYMFLRRNKLLHLMPKGKKITKLSYTDQELIDMSAEYSDYASIRDGNFALFRAMKVRGILPERLVYVPKKKKEKEKKKPAEKKPMPEPEPNPKDIIPKEFLKGNRKGAYACFRAIETEGGFACGRCRKEYSYSKRSRQCQDLCQQCYNDKIVYDTKGTIELNICGNIKDEYCHIALTLPDGPMYIGIEVSEQEKRKLVREGYAFLLK